MKKGKQLIGLPVVAGDNRREIEHIQGLVLDPSESRVCALLVNCDYSKRHARIIPLRNVRSFGTSSIAVSSARAIDDVIQIPESPVIKSRRASLTRTRLVSGDGTDVGTVEDILFNETTGKIASFQCVNDSKERHAKARSVLKLFEELDDSVIIHASELIQSEGNAPGFSDGFLPAKNEVESATALVTSDMSTSANPTKRILAKAGSLAGYGIVQDRHFTRNLWKSAIGVAFALYQRVLRSITDHRNQRASGKISGSAIFDCNNVKVVEVGEVITPKTIDRARRAGVLKELHSATRQRPEASTFNQGNKPTSGLLDDWWPPFI